MYILTILLNTIQIAKGSSKVELPRIGREVGLTMKHRCYESMALIKKPLMLTWKSLGF